VPQTAQIEFGFRDCGKMQKRRHPERSEASLLVLNVVATDSLEEARKIMPLQQTSKGGKALEPGK
jgi:hypothetical protein